MAWYKPRDVVKGTADAVRGGATSTIESARNAGTSTIESGRNTALSTIESRKNFDQRYNPYALAQEFRRSPFARGAYSRAAPWLPLPIPGAGLALQPEQMGIKNEENKENFTQSQRASRIASSVVAAVAGGYVAGPAVISWIGANPALAAKLGLTAASLYGALKDGGAGGGGGGGSMGPMPSTGVTPQPRAPMAGTPIERLRQYLAGPTPYPGAGSSVPPQAGQPQAPYPQPTRPGVAL